MKRFFSTPKDMTTKEAWQMRTWICLMVVVFVGCIWMFWQTPEGRIVLAAMGVVLTGLGIFFLWEEYSERKEKKENEVCR